MCMYIIGSRKGLGLDLVDAVDLVQFVCSGEERVEGRDFEKDAAGTPKVHLRSVVAVREQALGGAVPASRNVLRVWLLRINAAAGSEVGELQPPPHLRGVLDEDILGLDVPMENALAVHVMKGPHQLEHVAPD